ncbi:hypothetical protein SAMN05444920_110156 [Nonomuraea solani]|uniref:Peptidase inhibitor family I36 n=1 Tax=Nonomuraea solani TaxID=1144553 RepID=A0A1H6EJ81_9ACTN|nr:DUF6289 family protein [Nonomuraea solani]SEG96925.1 hypothetical protein SAMN05444920_110156 [Nonomuraea solani]
MIRRVLAVAALTTLALATVPAVAQAAPRCLAGYMCNSQYFSDSARTNLVGVKTEHCNGEVSMWGRVTGYLNWAAYPCT